MIREENPAMIETILREIRTTQDRKGQGQPVLLAIDGRCAAGKTTLARALQERLSCNVVPMDDFFLRPEQRTPERYQEPGGNVDRERFWEEVLLPLKSGTAFCYQPFDCRRMALGKPIYVSPKAITIIEGAYSCHPALWDFYDLHVFLTLSPNVQLRRLTDRNPEMLERFLQQWIPLEEQYFHAYDLETRCELRFDGAETPH